MAAPDEQQHGAKFNKRKRKKSFLANARGMGKKGKFGHGTQIDQDVYDYFVRVMELLKQDFENSEERDEIVAKAFVETEQAEIDLSSNQVGSSAVETLIRLTPVSTRGSAALRRFMQVFLSNLRIVATDRFASHVLESLLSKLTKYGLDKCPSGQEIENSSEEEKILTFEEALDWVLKVAKFALNNFDEFIWDDNANFVMRTILHCLSGSPPNINSAFRGAMNRQKEPRHDVFTSVFSTEEDSEEISNVPDRFKNVVKEYYERTFSFSQFCDLPYSNSTSLLLQTLLTALSRCQKKSKKAMIKQLIDRVFSVKDSEEDDKKDLSQDIKLLPVFTSNASMRLLEVALQYAPTKYVTQIYAACFMGHIVNLAVGPSTNFCVQWLLAKIGDPVEFEAIFEELAMGISEILTSGMTGVLLALAQACKRLNTKQGLFVERLMTALKCHEPAERRTLFVLLCLKLCTYDDYKAKEPNTTPVVSKDGASNQKFNLHGCLIIQTLLNFKKPINIISSILEISGPQLKDILCDTKGSHLMDAFVKSETVGGKSRERLLYKLQGSFVEMACSKHGSRALEALYATASEKNKMVIMGELASKHALVTGTPFGRIILLKWNMDLFRRSPNAWMQQHDQKKRTKDLFSDIISSQAVSKQ